MYTCEQCGKEFRKKGQIDDHIKRHALAKRPRNSKCLECDQTFFKLFDLRNHLEKKHNLKYEQHSYEFSTEEEFLQWKIKEEIRTNSQYVLRTGDLCPQGTKSYYICSRSGKHKEKLKNEFRGRQRKTKANGIKKIGFSCTAQIIAIKTEQDTYNVSFFPTHYGHENDIKHIHLNRYLKDCVASNLLSDIGPDSTLAQDVMASKSKEEVPILLQSAINESSESKEMKQLQKETKTDMDSIMKEIEIFNQTGSQKQKSIEQIREFLNTVKTFNNEIKKYNQPESDINNEFEIEKEVKIEYSQNNSDDEINIEQPSILSNLTSMQSEDIEYIVINFENGHDIL